MIEKKQFCLGGLCVIFLWICFLIIGNLLSIFISRPYSTSFGSEDGEQTSINTYSDSLASKIETIRNNKDKYNPEDYLIYDHICSFVENFDLEQDNKIQNANHLSVFDIILYLANYKNDSYSSSDFTFYYYRFLMTPSDYLFYRGKDGKKEVSDIEKKHLDGELKIINESALAYTHYLDFIKPFDNIDIMRINDFHFAEIRLDYVLFDRYKIMSETLDFIIELAEDEEKEISELEETPEEVKEEEQHEEE